MFPTVEVAASAEPGVQLRQTLLRDFQLRAEPGVSLGVFKHAVTRYKISLHAFEYRVRGVLKSSFTTEWHPAAGFDALALPAVHRRIATRIASR